MIWIYSFTIFFELVWLKYSFNILVLLLLGNMIWIYLNIDALFVVYKSAESSFIYNRVMNLKWIVFCWNLKHNAEDGKKKVRIREWNNYSCYTFSFFFWKCFIVYCLRMLYWDLFIVYTWLHCSLLVYWYWVGIPSISLGRISFMWISLLNVC